MSEARSSRARPRYLPRHAAGLPIGNTPVFPAPKDAARACNRHLFDDWLRRAYEITELARERWTLWHSIRRKWATERKGYPVRDVMEAGGWKNEETLLRSYQQLPGCWSQGATEQEALENIQDAIREYLAARDDLLRGTTVREVEVAGVHARRAAGSSTGSQARSTGRTSSSSPTPKSGSSRGSLDRRSTRR